MYLLSLASSTPAVSAETWAVATVSVKKSKSLFMAGGADIDLAAELAGGADGRGTRVA